ncbi:traB gene [Amycolatopsis methanolica 239]|uniref:TraB protein n=1 Tax=Amycolatopsis methanolica 239 TaxID=1068978 RepID=A0A076MQX2_AMYME|nr:traB gene [Amycolatopsis methanolica 239]prf//2124370B traB gene [Amycolatopsis methanolica]
MWRLDGDFEGTAELHIPGGTSAGSETLTLTSGQIGPQEEEFFGQSHCHWLAAAMSCMTGWELVGVKLYYPGQGWTAVHTAVATPDGAVLDIYGRHDSLDAFAERYRKLTGLEVEVRRLPREELFHDHLTTTDSRLIDDPLWWTRTDSDRRMPALYQHYARLVLTKAGHEVPEHCRPAPSPDANGTQTPPPPSTTATTTTTAGGTPAMSSIEEIRAVLAGSNEQAEGVLGALGQASQAVSEIQGRLHSVAGGSSQAPVQEALSLYAELRDTVEKLMGMVAAARSAVETYATSL